MQRMPRLPQRLHRISTTKTPQNCRITKQITPAQQNHQHHQIPAPPITSTAKPPKTNPQHNNTEHKSPAQRNHQQKVTSTTKTPNTNYKHTKKSTGQQNHQQNKNNNINFKILLRHHPNSHMFLHNSRFEQLHTHPL